MDVTRLLHAANEGDEDALEALVSLVYDELRWLAHSQLRGEFESRTLSTTALVNEAYLKLVNAPELPARNRRHFFAAAAQAMRHILISEARKRNATRRGSGKKPLSLESSEIYIDALSAELLSLDQALDRLEVNDARLARVVEYRFFAGLTIEETADVIDVSPITVKRDWRIARAWLFREMSRTPPEPQVA